MSSVLVTGTTRGLGLELVRSLLALPISCIRTVFATGRGTTPTSELQELITSSQGRLKYIVLDVTSDSSVADAAQEVVKFLGNSGSDENQPENGLDILINNAGVTQGYGPTSSMKISDLEFVFSVNVSAVHRVTSQFLPLLKKGTAKKIMNISTTVGSFGLVKNFEASLVAPYKVSKAALNMLTVQYSFELAPLGFTVFAVSPGWLKTGLGGGDAADMEPAEGATRTVNILMEATAAKDNGAFRDIYVEGSSTYTGANPPW